MVKCCLINQLLKNYFSDITKKSNIYFLFVFYTKFIVDIENFALFKLSFVSGKVSNIKNPNDGYSG